jgi:hypothetical protein
MARIASKWSGFTVIAKPAQGNEKLGNVKILWHVPTSIALESGFVLNLMEIDSMI